MSEEAIRLSAQEFEKRMQLKVRKPLAQWNEALETVRVGGTRVRCWGVCTPPWVCDCVYLPLHSPIVCIPCNTCVPPAGPHPRPGAPQ